MEQVSYFAIIIGAIFVNNVVLAQFLGICPFLGVSSKVETSLGMSAAVTFVMALTAVVAWSIQEFILVPFGIEYMQTIVFILVIAALVQMVEIILKKVSPSLYQALGIFLPLIAVNCAIMGASLFMQQRIQMDAATSTQAINSIWDSIAYALGSGIGWLLAIVSLAAIRERMAYTDVPKPLQGLGITFITVGLMAMAFMCFSGLNI